MPTLEILVGIPGSGKSTHARKWVEDDMEHRRVVSRDAVRSMLFGGVARSSSHGMDENAVTSVVTHTVRRCLRDGNNVMVDACHTMLKDLRSWVSLAQQIPGVQVNFVPMMTPLEMCVERNNQRPDDLRIPEEDLRRMANRLMETLGRLHEVSLD